MSDNYSYSKLDTFCQCGFKYKLKYEDGHYLYSNSIATEFGTAIHEAEETIANALKDGTPIEYNAIKNKFILKTAELSYKYATEYFTEDKSGRNYADKASIYLAEGVYRLEKFMNSHPTYKIVGAEIPFEFDYSDKHTFKGYIDRLICDSATGGYIIHDIKSYPVEVDKAKLATPLQFVIYTLAVAKMYGCNKAQIKCAYDLPLCDVIQPGGTAGFLDRGITKLDKLFESIGVADFKPSPSPLCYFCEFCHNNPSAPEEGKNLCPYYSHWTRAEKNFSTENEWKGLEMHGVIMERFKQKYNIKEEE